MPVFLSPSVCYHRPIGLPLSRSIPAPAVGASVHYVGRSSFNHSTLDFVPRVGPNHLGKGPRARLETPMMGLDGGLNPDWIDSLLAEGREPTVAIIDMFHEPYVDLNGDGRDDISHGEVVEKILTHQISCKVLRFTKPTAFLYSNLIVSQSKKILDYHRGVGKVAAVNISISKDASIESLARQIKQPDLSAQNIFQFKEEIRQYYLDTNHMLLGEAISALETLTSAGIAVYVAGGNRGPDFVNVFGMARKVISVGGTDAAGRTCPFSAENSLLVYAQGTMSISRGKGGYRLFDDQKVDVPYANWWSSLKSWAKTYPERFHGKPLNQVVSDIDDDYRHKQSYEQNRGEGSTSRSSYLFDKLYSLQKMRSLDLIGDQEYQRLVAGGYQLASFDNRYYFGIDQRDQTVVYDPAGNGAKNAMHHISGTSYSVPMALARDLKGKFV